MSTEDFLKAISSFSPSYREREAYSILCQRENIENLLGSSKPISFFYDFEDSKISIFENEKLYKCFHVELDRLHHLMKIINSLNRFVNLGLQTYTWKNRHKEEGFPADVLKCVQMLASGKTVEQVQGQISLEKKYFHKDLSDEDIQSFIVTNDSFLGRKHPEMVGTNHYAWVISAIIHKWNDRPAFPDPPSYKKPDMD
jgi:hypothetical protein